MRAECRRGDGRQCATALACMGLTPHTPIPKSGASNGVEESAGISARMPTALPLLVFR
jgi:hypothetical protein